MKNWLASLPKLADIYSAGQAICAAILIAMGYFHVKVIFATITLIIMEFCNAGAYYCTYISPPRRGHEETNSYAYWLELAPRIDLMFSTISGYAIFDYTDQMINHHVAYCASVCVVTIYIAIQAILYEYDNVIGYNLIEKNPPLAHYIIKARRYAYVAFLGIIVLYFFAHC